MKYLHGFLRGLTFSLFGIWLVIGYALVRRDSTNRFLGWAVKNGRLDEEKAAGFLLFAFCLLLAIFLARIYLGFRLKRLARHIEIAGPEGTTSFLVEAVEDHLEEKLLQDPNVVSGKIGIQGGTTTLGRGLRLTATVRLRNLDDAPATRDRLLALIKEAFARTVSADLPLKADILLDRPPGPTAPPPAEKA